MNAFTPEFANTTCTLYPWLFEKVLKMPMDPTWARNEYDGVEMPKQQALEIFRHAIAKAKQDLADHYNSPEYKSLRPTDDCEHPIRMKTYYLRQRVDSLHLKLGPVIARWLL